MAYASKQPAVTLSVRVSPEIREQLEHLSEATKRTKSFLTMEAIEHYLHAQAWQSKEIQKSIARANSKKANFASHAKVVKWLNSWGKKDELENPK